MGRMGDFAKIVARWPGKSMDARGIEHPAVHHMLDVAAVAERLAPPFPQPLRQALVLLAALHDLGKIGDAFRSMLRQGRPQDAGRHWEVSEALLRHHDALLAEALGGDEWARAELFAATAGHHGRPPMRDLTERRGRPTGAWLDMLEAAGESAIADAAAVIRGLSALWPQASLGQMTTGEAKHLSWRLAGLVTAADWVASTPEFFPASPAGPNAAAYLAEARDRVAPALAKAGLGRISPSSKPLFDFPMRPMQTACTEVTLRDGPMLALIEDETGSGKTEAALILARRMLSGGKAHGIYIALPTMATADAMFDRIFGIARRLFEGKPSLSLAHGRAHMHEGFRAMAATRDLNCDEPGPAAWLTDSRRKALLATLGIGTIDQAMLAVVRARFAALRQTALSDKILIVDEVHETSDPYMGALLAELLRLHAAAGGSAILMTATLPLRHRAKLLAAFEAGAGRPRPALPGPAYPALTVPGVTAPPVVARPAARGPVAVERVAALEMALDGLQTATGRGAAGVLVRNAVDEAISAHAALAARGVPVDILHARFTLTDRKRHESRVLTTYGKTRPLRPGRVLVATQVVESSLDLDFDVMVSDLAPMAALIQRAGRLWRHMDLRPAQDRAVPGPVLNVLSPDPGRVDGPDWARSVLGQGSFVYDTALLWRTARVLEDAREIRAPDELRGLIEAAHETDGPLPEALEAAALEAEGEAEAREAHAGQNMIAFDEGYRLGAAGASDAEYPTRLGREQRTLVLMRDTAPWAGGTWSVESCQLSEVQAGANRLARLDLSAAEPPAGLPEWLTATRTFLPVAADGTICAGLRYHGEIGLIFN